MKTDAIRIQCLNQSPFRTVAWRWEHAMRMLRTPKRAFDESTDVWVTRAMRHLSADSSIPGLTRCAHPQYDQQIQQAAVLFSEVENVSLRWFVEALLLTDEPIARIAVRTGLLPSTIETYGKLFFDVRSRVKATDWLLCQAVRCSAFNYFAGADKGGLWRHYAWRGGVHVLELYMAATGDAAWPAWLPRSVGSDDAQEIEQFKMKVCLTFKVKQAQTHEVVAKIVELMQDLRELPSAMPSIQQSNELRRHESFLTELPALKRKAKAREKRKGQSTGPSPEKHVPTNEIPQRIRKPK